MYICLFFILFQSDKSQKMSKLSTTSLEYCQYVLKPKVGFALGFAVMPVDYSPYCLLFENIKQLE